MVRRMKGKAGRPKAKNPRDIEIHTRLTAEEYYQFRQLHHTTGQTQAQVIRSALDAYAAIVLAEFMPEDVDEEE